MANEILTMLLVWHVGSVVLWFGSSVTFVMAVHPSLGTLSQDESRSYLRAFLPNFSKLLGAGIVSTAVAGILLLAYVSSVNTVLTPTGWKLVFLLIGALLGLIAAFLTVGVALPLASRFLDPSSQASDGPKYSALDEATMISSLNGIIKSITIMLLLVFVLMVMGAYS